MRGHREGDADAGWPQAASASPISPPPRCPGGRCRTARLGLEGVAALPVVLAAAEGALEGQLLDEAVIRRAAEAAAEEVEPMEDLQGSAGYRRDMVRVWVCRVVAELAGPEAR